MLPLFITYQSDWLHMGISVTYQTIVRPNRRVLKLVFLCVWWQWNEEMLLEKLIHLFVLSLREWTGDTFLLLLIFSPFSHPLSHFSLYPVRPLISDEPVVKPSLSRVELPCFYLFSAMLIWCISIIFVIH